jgi:hypothetical protein
MIEFYFAGATAKKPTKNKNGDAFCALCPY